MSKPFKVHELLSAAELAELEAFAREPGRTIDECHEWLQARKFTLSRGAVGNWKREFDLTDRFRASNETARALVDAAKSGGTVAISDAATLQLSQMLFEQMLRMQSGGEVETKELWAVSMALKNTIGSKRAIEALRTELAQALADAERKAADGASAGDVVATIKLALGLGQQQ